MRKEFANYMVNLIVVFIVLVLIILCNYNTMFQNHELIPTIYSIVFFIITIFILIAILNVKDNIAYSIEITKVLCPILIFMTFAESFIPLNPKSIFDSTQIITNFRFLIWVPIIDGIIIIKDSIKIGNILKNCNNTNVQNVTSQNYDQNQWSFNYSYNDNQDVSSNVSMLVDGYITDVIFDNQTQSYFLEIRYQYCNELYTFYIGDFYYDVSSILDSRNLRDIKVYIETNNPELARIDEENLRRNLEI